MSLMLSCPPEDPAIKPILAREGDFARVSGSNDRLLIEIWSARGIGSAAFEAANGWPMKATVRLYLRGLEYLQLSSGGVILEACVRSHPPHERQVRLKEAPPGVGKLGEQQEGDRFWLEVRAYDSAGREVAGLPPAGGFWEFDLPSELFQSREGRLCLKWIDFYR